MAANKSRRRVRTVLGRLALVASVLCAATVVAAAPASAAACGDSPPSDQDTGYGYVSGTTSGLNMRTGPWTSCSIVTVIPEGMTVYFWCYERGSNINGNSDWTFVSIIGYMYNYRGWVSEYYIRNAVYGQGFGSFVYCNY